MNKHPFVSLLLLILSVFMLPAHSEGNKLNDALHMLAGKWKGKVEARDEADKKNRVLRPTSLTVSPSILENFWSFNFVFLDAVNGAEMFELISPEEDKFLFHLTRVQGLSVKKVTRDVIALSVEPEKKVLRMRLIEASLFDDKPAMIRYQINRDQNALTIYKEVKPYGNKAFQIEEKFFFEKSS
ncbi:hypothetical protein [Algicola sagamiensis]|uniref:hypothetical protein n=1 Tax=Algicola sagamiensis TaxID=163869 RepID=UPI00036DC579|nr:hypothetical protein [Algicola sagamiensis]